MGGRPLDPGNYNPCFSWIASSTMRSGFQTSYRIEVFSGLEGSVDGQVVWDSGQVLSGQTLGIPYTGKRLDINKEYSYRITCRDNHGNQAISQFGIFKTGYPGRAEWTARWIGAGPRHDPLPPKGFFSGAKEEGALADSVNHDGRSLLLRHGFRLSGKVRSAVVSVTGLGLYELFINGVRVGDQQLSPAKTPYHKEILYDTFDVTRMLQQDFNVLGIHLGNGWYNPYRKWWQEYRMQWFGHKKAILQLRVEYADGHFETIVTDGSWKTAPGPSLYNCIYDGEVYDATKESLGWMKPGFDDSSWKQAIEVERPKGTLVPCSMPPVKVVQTIPGEKLTHPSPGVIICNFGQNFAGWTRLVLRGAKGTRIRIRHAEELDTAGNLDVTCNENAKATFEYTLKGEDEEVCVPRFTYFGFQYAEITAVPALPEILKIEGCVVHSDNRECGSFSCDNQLINKIHHATLWSQKSNMPGYPTDCPQRDERLGWMGDAQVTAEEAMFNFDMTGFYRNWFNGIRANQDDKTGDIPIISPRPYIRDDGVEWSSSYLTMIWDYYRYYGDKAVVLENYPAMSRYFRFLADHAKGVILPKGWIGDWGSSAANWKEGDPESVPTAYFYLDALLLSKMAGLTGMSEDSIYYSGMAVKIKAGYNAAFFHPDLNIYHDGSQMANAFPLHLGLVPEEKRPMVLSALVRQIQVTDSGHLTTGVLGTKYLPKALSAAGRADIVWNLVNRKGYPGWSLMMEKYNTLCEFWTLKQSHNHIMMGSIDSWFYETLAGINLKEEVPAFGRTVLRPYFPPGLNWVNCSVQTVRGKLESSWERNGNTLVMMVEIPFNCQSEIWIPVGKEARLTESGRKVENQNGITLLKKEGNYEVYSIGSGRYRFEVRYPAGKS